MSVKVELITEHSVLMDDVVGAALYLSVTFLIAFSMFDEKKKRNAAPGATERASMVRIEGSRCNHGLKCWAGGGRKLGGAAEGFKSCGSLLSHFLRVPRAEMEDVK